MKPRLRCRRAVLMTTAAGVVVGALALGVGPAFADTATADGGTNTQASTATTAPAATATAGTATSTPVGTSSSTPAGTASTTGTSTATDAATPATHWSSTAGAMPVDTGTEMDSIPSYAASSPTSPIQLGSVAAGASFSFDLRPTNATGATYTLTTVDGAPMTLDPTTSFVDGVLSGRATTAGTFVARVTATTPCGTASEWVTGTVTAGAASSVAVEASRAWSTDTPTAVTGSGSTSVARGGSLVIAAEIEDRYGNREDGTARAVVTSDESTDVIVDGPTGWVVSFPQASDHVITVSVDDVSTSFRVTVVPTTATSAATPHTGSAATPSIATSGDAGTTRSSGTAATTRSSGTAATTTVSTSTASTGSAATAPTSVSSPTSTTAVTAPVVVPTPAPVTAHVTTAASTDPVSGSTLASTGSITSGPLAWALGLLAAGAAVTGLRFRRRRRH